jgi:hypothetical protein
MTARGCVELADLSGGGDPAVPRHLPPPRPARRPREGPGRAGRRRHQPTGKASERFKAAYGCQPPRSFWIRAKQYPPGPIIRGICGQDFRP